MTIKDKRNYPPATTSRMEPGMKSSRAAFWGAAAVPAFVAAVLEFQKRVQHAAVKEDHTV